jgi:hypothetical protein
MDPATAAEAEAVMPVRPRGREVEEVEEVEACRAGIQ